ncbi:MAG TPA: hypothetical protein PLO50_11000, partial [Nitrospira sp.]|nr:hypothetical protein [Nitrospira sp.]
SAKTEDVTPVIITTDRTATIRILLDCIAYPPYMFVSVRYIFSLDQYLSSNPLHCFLSSRDWFFP